MLKPLLLLVASHYTIPSLEPFDEISIYINFSLHLPHPPQLDPDRKGRLPPTVTTPGSRPLTPAVSHPSDHKPGHMAARLVPLPLYNHALRRSIQLRQGFPAEAQ